MKFLCNIHDPEHPDAKRLVLPSPWETGKEAWEWQVRWLADKLITGVGNWGTCPVCGSVLGGLLDSFKWGFVHGCGFCTACDEARFRFYHYIAEGKSHFMAYALIGFD